MPEINAKMKESIKQNWDNLSKEEYDNRCKLISIGTQNAMTTAIDRWNIEVSEYCNEHNMIKLIDVINLYGTGFFQTDIFNLNCIKYRHRSLISKNLLPEIEKYANMNVRSKHETYLYDIVKLYCPDALQNTRKIIKNRELDIYIPSLKLAIEYNGIRFHNIEHSEKMKTLHLDKSIECRKRGIRLIHIYQFEDFQKQVQLLINLLEGTDNYPNNDFNKNNLIDTIPQSEIIYKTKKYTIYGAGKLVEC